MAHRVERVVVTEVRFFGNAAPTSGELTAVVDAAGINPCNGTNVFRFAVPNHSEKRPGVGERCLYEAAHKLIKAYMLKAPVTLEYVCGQNLPWITMVDYEGKLEIAPPTEPMK